jgi:uncharacterized protein (TIGR02598 family)
MKISCGKFHLPNFAFSLVEVTLSVGITAIGVISLVGLIPGGLDSLRKSNARVAEAKIVQAVTADFQMGDWGTRASGQRLEDREYHFDDRGFPVSSSDPWKHYTVKANIEQATTELNGVTIKGDITPNSYLYRLTIKITDQKDPTPAFTNPRLHHTYGNMVALIEQTDNNAVLIP